ncbi:hypothetical protein ACFVYJ_08550 [Pontibacter sp. JAM-7]|uniref:hypothetical protein n=1 Tax=Pontibacter sp. JAM-7 TaxID=3366581 RepID=UPI003AF72537
MKHAMKLSALTLACGVVHTAVLADTTIEVKNVGFATPESAEYYAAEDVILVSNINGHPAEKDRNGFISRLSPDGTVLDLKWIDGENDGVILNAPKGMTIIGKRLFVTDLDQVHIFQLPEGGSLGSVNISGSSFLNGITPLPDGSVLVTDTGVKADFSPAGNDAVYQVWSDRTYRKLMSLPNIGGPNGIWADDAGITLVTFGGGQVFKYDLTGKPLAEPVDLAKGLDGMVGLGDQRLLITSWGASAIYEFSGGQSKVVITDVDAPADIDIDSKRNRLLVPLFKQDKLLLIPLE